MGVAGGTVCKDRTCDRAGASICRLPADQAWHRAGVLSGGLVTCCGPDRLSLLVADLRRCLPHPPQRASRGDQLCLPGDKHVGLAKDSGGGNGVPALSPPASCGAAVGKRAEEGQGLASQTWPRNTHTHPQIGGIPSTTDSDSLVTCQAVHHWICLKRWTLYAKTGGQGTFQRSAGRPEATRSPAPPLPPCRVPGTPPPTPAIIGGRPPAALHPACAPLAMGHGAGPLSWLTCVPVEARKCLRAHPGPSQL